MATVTVRILGTEHNTIMGQVVDPSIIAQIISASLDSTQVVNIVDQEAIVEKPPAKSEDIDVEPPIDNVKDVIQKLESTEVLDTIDTLEIADSSDDMLCDLPKLATWIESDAPFPPSAPRDHTRRSKARKKS